MNLRCNLALCLGILTTNSFALDVFYRSEPVSVNISSDVSNVIRVPVRIQKAFSSTNGVDAKVKGSEIILTAQKGAGELVIQTSDKTYILLLQATSIPPAIIDIKDTSVQADKEIDKGKEYEDFTVNVIAKAIKHELSDDFEQQIFQKTVDTPDFVFVFEKKYVGNNVDVVIGKAINKTKSTKQLREDYRIIKDVVEKATKANKLASALSKEFIKPGDTTVLWSVVSKTKKEEILTGFERTKDDEIIEKYIRQKEALK